MGIFDYLKSMRAITGLIIAGIVVVLFDYFITPYLPIIGGKSFLVTSGNLKIAGIGFGVIVIVSFIIFRIIGAERRAEVKLRVGKHILKKLKSVRGIGTLVTKYLGRTYGTPKGELVYMLKDLRLELYTLMNYLLRHEIYRAKSNAIKATHKKIEGKETPMQTVELTEDALRKALKEDVEGSEVYKVTKDGSIIQIQEKEGKMVKIKKDRSGEETSEEIQEIGGRIFKIKKDIRGEEIAKDEITREQLAQFWRDDPDNPAVDWVLEGDRYGIARKSIAVYKLMKELKNALELDLSGDTDPEPVANDRWVTEKIVPMIESMMVSFDDAYDRYKATIKRFKVLNFVRAYRFYFMDMYNMYGQYVRGFNFARKGTIPKIYVVKAVSNGVQRDIDWDTAVEVGDGIPTDYEPETSNPPSLVEVNLFGYAVRDINIIQIELGHPNTHPATSRQFPYELDLPHLPNEVDGRGVYYIRKYKKKDIVWFYEETLGRFSHTLGLSKLDWEYYVEDMWKGRFHPYSKRIDDYRAVIARGDLNFDSAKFKGLLQYNETAFDREALKDPGKFVYWGRKGHRDTTSSSPRLYPANPYPGVSIEGLWDFINRAAKRHTKETDLVRAYLDNYFRMQEELLPTSAGEAPPSGQTRG